MIIYCFEECRTAAIGDIKAVKSDIYPGIITSSRKEKRDPASQRLGFSLKIPRWTCRFFQEIGL